MSPRSRYEARIARERAQDIIPDYDPRMDETNYPLEMALLTSRPPADLTSEQRLKWRSAEQERKAERNAKAHEEQLKKELKLESHGLLTVNHNCFSNSLRGHSFMFDLDKYVLKKKRGFRSDLPKLEHRGITYTGPELMRKIMLNSGSATALDLSEEQLRRLMINDHHNCTHGDDVPDSDTEEDPLERLGECTVA